LETAGIAFDSAGDELMQAAAEGQLTAWRVTSDGRLRQPVQYASIVPEYAIAVSSQGFIAAADDRHEIEILTDVPAKTAELKSALRRAIAVEREQQGRWRLLANGGYNVEGELPDIDAEQLAATGGLGPGALTIGWYINRRSAGGKTTRVMIARGAAQFTFQNLTFNGIPLTPQGRRILEKDEPLSVIARGVFTPANGHAITASTSFTLPPCRDNECRRLVGH
jgi:hypothetical protein